MKFAKYAVAVATLGLTSVAFAADPLVGNWVTKDDKDGKPKAVVTISENGGVFSGKITEGLTDKAKEIAKDANKAKVFTGLKASGGGKYSGGQITDPASGKTYSMDATLNGNTLTIKGGIKVLGKVVGRTQVWTRK